MSHSTTAFAYPQDLRDEARRDSADVVLAAALLVGWFSDEALDVMSRELQAQIAKALAEYVYEAGGAIWPALPAALRRAWDEYLMVDGDAEAIDRRVWFEVQRAHDATHGEEAAS